MWELGYRWCTEEVACENKGRRAPSASQTERFQKKPTMLTTWPWMVAFIVKKKNTFLSSLQSLSCVWLFATLWTAAHQASLSITNSQSILRFMSIESVMQSNHLIFCHPLLLLSIIPSIRSFQMSQLFISGGQSIGVSALASILPMNIQDWFSLGWIGWISSQSKGLSRVFPNTTVQQHQFFITQLSLWSNSHINTWLLEKP